MQMQKAARKKVKIKMAISAPTGFGKTYSALLLAHGITEDWTKICVIDSENASADLYSDLGDYNTISMSPPYNVDSFVKAVKLAIDGGIEVIIVDSTYHYWHGKGGLLEYNNSLGGRYQDWAKTNPLYSKWLDTILQSPVHFICTSRKKQAYEMSKDSSGKTIVEKKGMEDEIRSGFDYEMTLAFNIVNDKHMAEAAKDRTRLFAGKQEFVITEDTGKLIKQWCESGVAPVDPMAEAIASMLVATTLDEVKQTWSKFNQFQKRPEFEAAKEQMKKKLTPGISQSDIYAQEPAPAIEGHGRD